MTDPPRESSDAAAPDASDIAPTPGAAGHRSRLEVLHSSHPLALAEHLGMTGLVASAISASADASTVERVVTLLVAVYALLWATWTLIRATRAVHGLAWDLHELPRLTRP